MNDMIENNDIGKTITRGDLLKLYAKIMKACDIFEPCDEVITLEDAIDYIYQELRKHDIDMTITDTINKTGWPDIVVLGIIRSHGLNLTSINQLTSVKTKIGWDSTNENFGLHTELEYIEPKLFGSESIDENKV